MYLLYYLLLSLDINNNTHFLYTLVIVGRNKENVAEAYHRINNIVKEARRKFGDYTHFVSIPMNDPTIIEGFYKFKKEVLTKYRDVCI